MHREERRRAGGCHIAGPGRGTAFVMLAAACVSLAAATPRPAAARELREALEILEQEERERAAAEQAERDLRLLEAPAPQPRRPSLAVGMALSGGVTFAGLMLGGLMMEGSVFLGSLTLASAAVLGPSLGRFYFRQHSWAAILTSARLASALLVVQGIVSGDFPFGSSAAVEIGLTSWFALTLFDVLSLPFTRPEFETPKRPHSAAPVVVAPWLAPDGGGGAGGGLALVGRLP